MEPYSKKVNRLDVAKELKASRGSRRRKNERTYAGPVEGKVSPRLPRG